jgi:EmrB/QacA subfamily drug resistance transporter
MTPLNSRIRLVLGGFLAMLVLAALDQTILSTALPAIGAELHAQDRLAWVFSAYLMASTVAIPLYGRLADAYGTRAPLLAAIALFSLGSFVCGTADGLAQLVVARAIQGAGGGGLMTLTLLGVRELVPPAQRATWTGMLGATYGLATLLGPLAGGYLVQHASWHWAFFINLPVAVLALGLIAACMPRAEARPGERIDVLGAALLAGTLVSLLLATRRDTAQPAAWSVGALLSVAAACAAGFVFSQRRTPHPILPLSLFAQRVFSASAGLSAVSGVALFSAVVFLPTYLQSVLRLTPTTSAWHLLPLMGGITLAARLTGLALRAGVGARKLALAACTAMAASLFALAAVFQAWPAQALALAACLLPLGLGIGTLFPVVTALAQRSAPARHVGVATSTPVMIRSLGGALGVSVLGSVLAGGIAQRLGAARARIPHERFGAAFAAAAQPVYLGVGALCLLAAAMAWVCLPTRTPAPAAA